MLYFWLFRSRCLELLSSTKRTSIILINKDHNSSHIHRFRHITIIENYLQWIVSYIWASCLSSKFSGEEFLQSNRYDRKQPPCEESILNKNFWFDLQRIYGTETVIFDYDVKSCYDRIVPTSAAYVSQRLGLHPIKCSFIAFLLKSMRHHLVIGGKPTNNFFSYIHPYPLFGSGQGAGWSPFLWTSIDDIILQAMAQHHPGLSFS